MEQDKYHTKALIYLQNVYLIVHTINPVETTN